MKLVIVGGGKLGFFLAQNMMNRGHQIMLVELDKKRCALLATSLDAIVLNGDGTELNILRQAEIETADSFIAVSGRDEDNVVACQIAKRVFHVPQVVARVNNPKNLETIRRLGADVTVCNTEIITRIIEQEVVSQEMHLLATVNHGRSPVCALTLSKDSPLAGKAIKDIRIPEEALIISIVRGETTIIPKGNTTIYGGDELIAVCGNAECRKALLKALR